MIRRIIALTLWVTLLLNLISFNVSANIINEENIEKEKTVLTTLGIMSDFENLSYKVSRAEFITYAAKMIQLSPVENKTYFIDVTPAVKNFGYINAALEYGMIDRAEDHLFNPKDNITFEQAYKVLVCAAGFRAYAESYGKDLSSYTTVAKRLGITLTNTASSEITYLDATVLLYRALTINMSSVYGVNDDGLLGEVVMGKSVMTEFHNAFEYIGRVESVCNSTISGDLAEAENESYINGELYMLADGIDLRQYFGEQIEFVYIYNEGEDTKTIIYAKRLYDEDVLVIEDEYIYDYDSSTRELRYYKSEIAQRTSSIKIANGAIISKNGVLLEETLSTTIQQFTSGEIKGRIKIVEEDHENKIVLIEAYETIIVSAFDSANEVIYDKNNLNEPIKFSDYDEVSVLDANGQEIAMPTAYPAPVSVAKTTDKSRLEVRVYDKIATGNINRINHLNSTIKLDDVLYTVDKGQAPTLLNQFRLGEKVRVYVDFMGDVAYITYNTKDEMEVAYLIASASKKGPFATKMKLKVFGYTTGVNIFDIAESVIIDGVKYKEPTNAQMAMAFPGSNSYTSSSLTLDDQIIRFKTNANGEIIEIDTYNVLPETEDPNTTLKRVDDGTTYIRWYANLSGFGLNRPVDKGAKHFRVPNLNESGLASSGGQYVSPTDRMYVTYNGPTFTDDAQYKLELFTYKNSGLIDIILQKGADNRSDHSLVYMFEDYYTELNDEGEPVMMLNLWSRQGKGVKPVSYFAEEQVKALQKGDLIYVEQNVRLDTIVKVTKMFDGKLKIIPGDKKYYTNFSESDPLEVGLNLFRTYASNVTPAVVSGSYEPYDAAAGKYDNVWYVPNIKIIVFDPTRDANQIFMGTEQDIISYKDAGLDCDILAVHTDKSAARTMFVFK